MLLAISSCHSYTLARELAKGMASGVSETHRDVIVVGAGWSGILACKCMLEEGLSVLTLEKRPSIGGVWAYSDDPTVTSVMKITQCSSSSTVTEISDYPMPDEIGMFPHHTDVLEYLQAYAKEFSLYPHIRLNAGVEAVEKRDDIWRVTCSNGDVCTSTYIVIAAGLHQKPNRELEDTMLKGFTGKILHACEIKQPLEEYRDSRLLLLGGGETGSDICLDWFQHSKFIYWSIPRGQHFFRKYAKVVPWGKAQALDKASSRMMKKIAPYHRSKPGLAWVCKWTSGGSLLAYQGHGIPEWRNDAEFFKYFINKNGKVLDLVDYERLVPKGTIVECKGKEVTFIDGTKQEFDLAIMSTGYKVEYPYLPEKYHSAGVRGRHKMVFDVEDPTLAFIGLVRPIVGSLVALSEMQARWAARQFSQKVPLKSLEERRRDVQQDTAHWSEYFKHSSQRIEGLVEAFTYVEDIANHAHFYPDYWSLFKNSPSNWAVAFFSPLNPSMHRLNEPEKLEQAISNLKRHGKGTLSPLQYLLILFMRCIWFDWWLNRVSTVKYWIQTSSWWPTVRSWRVTKGINYLWTLPKRVFFDNVSDDQDEVSPRAKLLLKSIKRSRHLANGRIGNGVTSHSNGINHLSNGVSSAKVHARNRDATN